MCGLNETKLNGTKRDGGERAQGASQGPCPHGREGQKEGSWGRGLGRRRAQIFIHIDAATQRLGGDPRGFSDMIFAEEGHSCRAVTYWWETAWQLAPAAAQAQAQAGVHRHSAQNQIPDSQRMEAPPRDAIAARGSCP